MTLKSYFFVSILILSNQLFTQELDISWLSNMKARNIGPAGMSGRITAIDAGRQNPDVIYVGSASGGVWKSTSGGIQWAPIFDNQTTASIGAIAIQPNNPSVVWVGTGEGNPRNSLNAGDGIYKSLDGGDTWQKMGLADTRHIHRIRIDPTNPDIVYVAAIGSPWGDHQERGVYKTTDGGKNWNKILYNNPRTGCAELVMDPKNPNKLIAAMWEHHRDPWFFKSGGIGSGLYVTLDGGETWQKRTEENGLPAGELGRIGLAIAPSQPARVYALIESSKNALYRSEDGGKNWEMINDKEEIGNRPFYYSEIYVDPVNENRLYSIYTYVNYSEDGGKSFKSLMPAYNTTRGVHPDHHAWWIHPDNPNLIYEGNDGGLNISRDRGKSWRFVSNLPVGQFYHVNVDNEIPYNVYGGMQDNGSWVGPAYVWKDQGIRNSYWQEIAFGDGFDVLPDPENSRFGIATSQQGYASIYDRETGYNEIIRPTPPNDETQLRFNWNAAMNRDPFDAKTLYFGSQFVHKSTDGGQSWSIISPDLTTNDKSRQKQGDSGGLTMDATGAENYCTILVIEPSPLQKNLLWVGTDDGRVHITQDGGSNWTEVTAKLPNFPEGAWIAQIKASNKNKGAALLVANDYRRFNHEPLAYRTTNFGKSWERIVDKEDINSYTLSIIEDPVTDQLLFLGTDNGLYFSLNAGKKWIKWTHGFPTVNAYDLVIHPREHDLVIGTFGRSFYVLDDIRPLRALAQDGSRILNKTLHVFDPPEAFLSAEQQPRATRFGADATYNGENRPTGARIRFFMSPEEVIKEEEETKDSIEVQIRKDQRMIRTLRVGVPKTKGLQQVIWELDEKGLPELSRKSESENKKEPGGQPVLPGTYVVRIQYKDWLDSTVVEVKKDPRLPITLSAMQAKYDALSELQESYSKAYKAVERIKACKTIVTDIQTLMKDKDPSAFSDAITQSDSVNQSLTELLDYFFGPKDSRQGITRDSPKSVTSNYALARSYVSNGTHAPGVTEEALITQFKRTLDEALKEVNDFYRNQWPTYRASIEKINLSPLKDYEDIR